jgi:hypothetical protein
MNGKMIVTAILLVLAGCSDDASTVADLTDAAAGDAGPTIDSGISPEFGTPCDQACQVVDAILTVGSEERRIERAFYGISESPDAEFELYIEAYRGGAQGCPTDQSPMPEQTLVLSGIPIPPPGEIGGVDSDAGLRVNLLDFEGLVAQPVLPAESAALTWNSVSICSECNEQDDSGFLSFEIEAEFGADGSLSGQLYATHCVTLDVRPL